MRWIEQALALGLLQREGSADAAVYRIASWQRGAALAGVSRLMPPVLVEREALLAKGWLAVCWAAFLLRFDGLVSRAALEALSGVHARTQVAYEHAAGVINRANYASYGKVPDDPELATGGLPAAVGLAAKAGHYFKRGELRRRLPNSRDCSNIQTIRLTGRGRIKAINRALEIVAGSPQLCSQPVANSPSVFELEPLRLYCTSEKQTKQARHQHKKWQGDPRERVQFRFEFAHWHNGKGIFSAVAL